MTPIFVYNHLTSIGTTNTTHDTDATWTK